MQQSTSAENKRVSGQLEIDVADMEDILQHLPSMQEFPSVKAIQRGNVDNLSAELRSPIKARSAKKHKNTGSGIVKSSRGQRISDKDLAKLSSKQRERIIKNRQSARKAKDRKAAQIDALQTEISELQAKHNELDKMLPTLVRMAYGDQESDKVAS